MNERIRKITVQDFKHISDLFETGNSIEELKWLFADPNSLNDFNGYVAVDQNDNILGVIGYVMSSYVEGSIHFNGMIPMSWKLKKNYKGLAGISLFRKVSELGDLSIAIGGSDVARQLYPLFKYEQKLVGYYSYKILKPMKYFNILKRTSMVKKIGMFTYLIPSYFKNVKRRYLNVDLDFVPYDFKNYVDGKYDNLVCGKKVNKNYIDWLLKCPTIESYGFAIKEKNDNLGVCVLYKYKIKNTYIGRIVHMPFLGFNRKLWACVLNKCIEFLRHEGCCVVTGLSINQTFLKGLKDVGFVRIEKHVEPLYLKDKNRISEEFNLNEWHFQFSEGDIAIRNF